MQGPSSQQPGQPVFDPDQFQQNLIEVVRGILDEFAQQYGLRKPSSPPIYWPVYFYRPLIIPMERPEQPESPEMQRFHARMREFWKSLLDEIEGDRL